MRWTTPMFGILIILVGLVTALYLVQRQFIYFPTRQDLPQAELEAKQRGLEPWLHEGQFIGWRAPYLAGNATGSVLVLHGNAGAAIHRTYFRNLFQSSALDARFDVYLLEYPGFGPRPGSPSEASLLQAADEAIMQLQQDSHKPILLVGESLGTVVAAIAGSRKPEAVQGMLLVTPFPNLPALARQHYPWLPAWFLRDGFRADKALAAFPGPVAFLLAGQDTIAPPGLGLAFFDGYPGTKRLWVEADAGHNTLDYSPRRAVWREILAFCRGCLEQWHSIQKGRPLTPEEKAYILLVLKTWLGNQASHDDAPTPVQAESLIGWWNKSRMSPHTAESLTQQPMKEAATETFTDVRVTVDSNNIGW